MFNKFVDKNIASLTLVCFLYCSFITTISYSFSANEKIKVRINKERIASILNNELKESKQLFVDRIVTLIMVKYDKKTLQSKSKVELLNICKQGTEEYFQRKGQDLINKVMNFYYPEIEKKQLTNQNSDSDVGVIKQGIDPEIIKYILIAIGVAIFALLVISVFIVVIVLITENVSSPALLEIDRDDVFDRIEPGPDLDSSVYQITLGMDLLVMCRDKATSNPRTFRKYYTAVGVFFNKEKAVDLAIDILEKEGEEYISTLKDKFEIIDIEEQITIVSDVVVKR